MVGNDCTCLTQMRNLVFFDLVPPAGDETQPHRRGSGDSRGNRILPACNSTTPNTTSSKHVESRPSMIDDDDDDDDVTCAALFHPTQLPLSCPRANGLPKANRTIEEET